MFGYKKSKKFFRIMLPYAMADILGVKRILVGKAIYNTAKEGKAFQGADIWSDDFAMVLAAVIALSYPVALAVISKKVWKRKKK